MPVESPWANNGIAKHPLGGYPYRETRVSTGTIYTDKLFTGQREMAGWGIYHYGARFYSPKVGRFLSPDTIIPGAANPQAWNRYSYVLGNPLKYTDPTGHMQACAGCGHGDEQLVFEIFKDSPFAEYYAALVVTERSVYEFHSNSTEANKILMEAHIANARFFKAGALNRVPSGKLTDAMLVYPEILGGGYVGGEVDLGSEYGGFGGSVVDAGATPILAYMTSTPTSTQTSTPTLTSRPTQRHIPSRTPRPTPAPRRFGGEVMMD